MKMHIRILLLVVLMVPIRQAFCWKQQHLCPEEGLNGIYMVPETRGPFFSFTVWSSVKHVMCLKNNSHLDSWPICPGVEKTYQNEDEIREF